MSRQKQFVVGESNKKKGEFAVILHEIDSETKQITCSSVVVVGFKSAEDAEAHITSMEREGLAV